MSYVTGNSIYTVTMFLRGGAQARPAPAQETLHSAIIDKKPIEEIARLIQPRNINEVVNGKSALYLAVESGDIELVRLLGKHEPDVTIGDSESGNSCLHLAVLQNSAPMLEVLNLLRRALDLEHRNNSDFTPFFLACKEGKADAAKALQNMGASLDVKVGHAKETALHHAAAGGHVKIIELFGNRPDLVNSCTLEWPMQGATPFHIACLNGQLEAARTLLTIGASLDATFNGIVASQRIKNLTGLHVAAEKGHTSIIELFKDRPDILCALTLGGSTAQDFAFFASKTDFLKELVKHVEPKVSKDLFRKSTEAIMDFYSNNFPSRVEMHLQIIRGSCTLEQEKAIARCIEDYFLLNYNNRMQNTKASCDQLFDFIKEQQSRRIDAALVIVTSSDKKCPEEDLHALLETMSMQHFLYEKLNHHSSDLHSLTLRLLPLFTSLEAILERLFEWLVQRTVGVEELKRLSLQIDAIASLASKIFNWGMSDAIIRSFREKYDDCLKQLKSPKPEEVIGKLQKLHIDNK